MNITFDELSNKISSMSVPLEPQLGRSMHFNKKKNSATIISKRIPLHIVNNATNISILIDDCSTMHDK